MQLNETSIQNNCGKYLPWYKYCLFVLVLAFLI